MSAILIYAIKSAIVLTLLFVPGIFLLFKEKMFRFNRITLLGILVLSLLLPLCNVSLLSMDHVPAVQAIEQGLLEMGVPVEVANLSPALSPGEQVSKPFPWFYIVSILYAIGVMTVLGIRLYEVFSMGRIIRRGSIWTKREQDGIRIYCHAEDVTPFSWLRSIVISEQDYHENGREIILHEKAHILRRHSLDIILLTLVEAVQWWNPFVYMLGMYLRDVHEFEADDYVLLSGVSAHSYSELIIRKAVGASSYTFANNFNHSLTKKRINMMHKTNPKRSLRSRALYVLPMIALALSAFATSEFQKASELIEQTVKPSSNIFTLKGTVPSELNVDHYEVLIGEFGHHPNDFPKGVKDTVNVKDGKFEYTKTLDQPYSAALAAVKKDGTKSLWMMFFFVPGEDCKMDIYGDDIDDFTLSGSKFYSDWEAFRQYEKETVRKAKEAGSGKFADEYRKAIADYNRQHKDEEGCIMYQYLFGYELDYAIADGIQDGRFGNYIMNKRQIHKESEEYYNNIVYIHIDSEDKLFIKKKGEKEFTHVSPQKLMQTLSKYKNMPTTINISTEKELDHMERTVTEVCRRNNLLHINYMEVGETR